MSHSFYSVTEGIERVVPRGNQSLRVVSLVNDLTVTHPFKVSVQLIRLITERAGHRGVEFGAIKVLCEWADTSRRHGRVEQNAVTKARIVVLNREMDVIH